jgi:hypothetical protein
MNGHICIWDFAAESALPRLRYYGRTDEHRTLSCLYSGLNAEEIHRMAAFYVRFFPTGIEAIALA